MENLGFVFALSTALAWGTYVVPFKKSRSANLIQFQTLMTIGVFIFALIISPFLGYSFGLNLYGIIGGIMWASANAISLVAVSDMGMSKAFPIWVSAVILTSFIWGNFFFKEMPEGFLIGVIGIILIIIGVVTVGVTKNVISKNVKRGILLSLLAGVIWGSQLVPLKIANLTSSEFFFPMSFGILLFGTGLFLIKRQKFENKAIFGSLSSGVIWSIGNLFSIIAVSLIGLAKGLPLTQSAVLISVLWGVFYFKEITLKKEIVKVIIGAIVLIFGIIILSLA